MDIGELVKAELEALGVEVRGDAKTIGATVRAMTKLLAQARTEPDFNESLKAAAETVMLAAAKTAIRRGDAADARAWSFVDGFLMGRVA